MRARRVAPEIKRTEKPFEPRLTWRELVIPLYRHLKFMKGKKNAKTATVLSEWLGLPPTRDNRLVRRAAKVLLNRYDLPFISGNEGFFIAWSKKQVDEYIDSLEKRISGMKRDIRTLRDINRTKRWRRTKIDKGRNTTRRTKKRRKK